MGGAAAKPAEEEAWPKQAGNDGIGLILGFGGIFFLMLAKEQDICVNDAEDTGL